MKRRSGEAVAARARNSAGPMRHRLQPRGGARNEQAEFLDENDAEGDEPIEGDEELPVAEPELRCHRSACRTTHNVIATHRDTQEKYCLACARKINAACNQEIVTWVAR